MKRIKLFTIIMLAALLTLLTTSCGTYEFGADTDPNGKQSTITAKNADKDDFFAGGTFELADGEQFVITSNMTRGSIQVELFATPEEQSIDELPDLDDKASITAVLSDKEEVKKEAAAGSYLLKATCLEKADGTVRIEVKPST